MSNMITYKNNDKYIQLSNELTDVLISILGLSDTKVAKINYEKNIIFLPQYANAIYVIQNNELINFINLKRNINNSILIRYKTKIIET